MTKILFIEDEPGLQKALSESLTEAGYEILSALDGQTGLDLAKKETPDLILLDLILPQKTGFEILKELKQNQNTHAIPVIILSNLEQTEEVGKALELGATTYLVKTNYHLTEVVQKIEEALK